MDSLISTVNKFYVKPFWFYINFKGELSEHHQLKKKNDIYFMFKIQDKFTQQSMYQYFISNHFEKHPTSVSFKGR